MLNVIFQIGRRRTVWLIILDQITKLFALLLRPNGYTLIPGLVHMELNKNKGISFSMLSNLNYNQILILHSISLILLIMSMCIYVAIYRQKTSIFNFSWLMIIAGSASNYLDRMIYGCIIDMFRFTIFNHDLFICNLADIYITIGFVLFIIQSQFRKRTQSKFTNYNLHKDFNGL